MAFRLRARRSLFLVNQFLCNKQKPATVSPPVSHLLHVSASPTLSSSTRLAMRPFTSTTSLFMSYRGDKYVNGDITPRPHPVHTDLSKGCDYNRWLIAIDFPKDANVSPVQMIATYFNTAAQIFDSVDEAKKKIYALSTTTYHGFQVECTKETSEKCKGLPGVVYVLPDSYIDHVNEEYGGDNYVNGDITPRPSPLHTGRRNDGDSRYPREQNSGPNFLQHHIKLKDLLIKDLSIDVEDPNMSVNLLSAASTGNAAIDVEDPNMSVNLLSAASTGNAAFLNELVEARLDFDVGDSKGRTPLHIAAPKGYEVCVHVLLQHRSSLHSKDLNRKSVLWNAIESKHYTAFKTLYHLASIFDPDIAGDLLTMAARRNNLTVMKELLKNGLYVDSKDRHGLTAIEVATNEDHIDMVKILLVYGSEVNEKVSDNLSFLSMEEILLKTEGRYDRIFIPETLDQHVVSTNEKEKEQLQESTNGIVFPRITIHRGHSNSRKEQPGRSIKLPNSLVELKKIIGEKFGFDATNALLANEEGAEIDSIEAIRDNDKLFIVECPNSTM